MPPEAWGAIGVLGAALIAALVAIPIRRADTRATTAAAAEKEQSASAMLQTRAVELVTEVEHLWEKRLQDAEARLERIEKREQAALDTAADTLSACRRCEERLARLEAQLIGLGEVPVNGEQ